MNETIKTLLARRSVRTYRPEQIAPQELDAILEAGTYAPSAHGKQSVTLVVVQDRETIAALSAANAEIMGTKADPFYGAPTVVVVLADPEATTTPLNAQRDGALVMGNMMNAAASLGVGSCWINRAKEFFDKPEGKAMLRKWGLPERLEGVGNCALGYPAGEPRPAAPRKDGFIVRV